MTIAFYGIEPNLNPCNGKDSSKVNTNIFYEIREIPQYPKDILEFSSKESSKPQVNLKLRNILFSRFNDKQINQINAAGELPDNAKITDLNKIVWNKFNITKGSHKIPQGYELKNDILGFTHVVRKDSKAWYLKETKPANS